MTNEENMIMARVMRTGKVERFVDERRDGDDSENGGGNGIWAYLVPGWKCSISDTHAVHEWTVKDVERCVQNAVPCNCGCAK